MFKISVLVAAVLGFLGSCRGFVVGNGASRAIARVGALKMVPLGSMAPVAVSPPAFALTDVMNSLPVSLEVTFAAYLAVLLGTFVPVTFLIVLYSQSEARKAGARSN